MYNLVDGKSSKRPSQNDSGGDAGKVAGRHGNALKSAASDVRASSQSLEGATEDTALARARLEAGAFYRWAVKNDRVLDSLPKEASLDERSVEHEVWIPSRKPKALVTKATYGTLKMIGAGSSPSTSGARGGFRGSQPGSPGSPGSRMIILGMMLGRGLSSLPFAWPASLASISMARSRSEILAPACSPRATDASNRRCSSNVITAALAVSRCNSCTRCRTLSFLNKRDAPASALAPCVP